METTGYKLVDLIRKTSDETQNHQTSLVLTWAADEIEKLIHETRMADKEGKMLLKLLNDNRGEAVEFRDSLITLDWQKPKLFSWESNQANAEHTDR